VGDRSSPLDWEEAPTEAARLVILLLPHGDWQKAGSSPAYTPIASFGTAPAARRVRPAADPAFATCYHAEMPALIGFLVKCGAHHRDAANDAQETFLELFEKWQSVRNPRRWLRATAFRIFLRRPVGNTPPMAVNHAIPRSPGTLDHSGFGADEELLLDALELLPTTQRAVLALHYDQFRNRDIAHILGMKQAIVRRNLAEGRAALEDRLDLSGGRPQPRHEPPAGGAGG